MLYDLSNPVDRQKAIQRFKKMLDDQIKIDLTSKQNRTLKQNAYLHLILQYFACCYGDEMEYCKRQFFKLEANKELFEYEHINRQTGEIRTALRSSRDLDTKEMILAIDRFKNYSSSIGIILPDAEQKDFIFEAQKEVERNKEFI